MAGHLEHFEPFFSDIGDGTAFEVVLRGHLWVEAELLRSLRSALPFPDLAGLDRLPFGEKVGLVAAHGLMQADESPGFRRLNTLRNRLAHSLGADPTAADETDLLNALGQRHREHVAAVIADGMEGEFPNRLRFAVAAMCVQLQEDRRRHVEAHARLRASAQRLLDIARAKGLDG